MEVPVISSILSAEHLSKIIGKKFNLPGRVSCKLLKAGINHTYIVRNEDSNFVLRLYTLNWRSDLEIREEIRLLKILEESGINISVPIMDIDGQYIQYIEAPEGLRQALLFTFAEGSKLLNIPADLHYKIGVTLAKIHEATINLQLQRVTYTPAVVLNDALLQLQEYIPGDSEELAWMKVAQRYLLKEFEKIDTTQMRFGAVHLDIWFDNMHISRDGQITIFDFDFCGNGWLAYDIAYYILQLHSTEKDSADRDLKVGQFLNGYESITKLSDEEKRFLPMFGVSLYFFYLGVQCQRYENWSNVFLNETYLKRFITLLVRKYFEENVGADLQYTSRK